MYNYTMENPFKSQNSSLYIHKGQFGSDNSTTRLHHDSRFGLVVGTFFVLTKQ